MQRLMAQAQRIAVDGAVEFIARRPAPFTHQGLIAAEGAQPIPEWRPSGGNTQVGKQLFDSAASGQVCACSNRSPFHEMEMAVDKPRRDGSARKPHHPGLLT